MNLDFSEIIPSLPYILGGVWYTLALAVGSALCGTILGMALTLLKYSKYRPLKQIAFIYTDIIRGTPLLLQLSLVYFALPQILNINMPGLAAAFIAFGVNSSAYVSEILRAGIDSVARGQIEAAVSLGVPRRAVFKDIVLPQALTTILPALINEMIMLVKETAVVSFIGIADIMRRVNIVSSANYRYFEPMLVAALVYYILVKTLTFLGGIVEKRIKIYD